MDLQDIWINFQLIYLRNLTIWINFPLSFQDVQHAEAHIFSNTIWIYISSHNHHHNPGFDKKNN